MTHPDVPQVTEKKEQLMEYSEELHHLFVSELRLRRLKFLDVFHMLCILHFYVHSGTLHQRGTAESSGALFVEACDRQLGKNSQDLNAAHINWLFKLYKQMREQGTPNSLSHKLLIKLQRQILSLYDWRKPDAPS